MKIRMLSWLLAAALPVYAVAAEPAANEDTPDEIAQDAARDLKDSRFYNKPGATRADYDKAWQECRLIARGSRTPGGTSVIVYNPNVISPAAAGAAGAAGSLIGALIAEGEARRANRRECLLVRGWRWVEVDSATRAKVAAMSDAERSAYFDRIVGATDLNGFEVTEWTNSFAAPQLAPEAEQ